MVHTLRIDNYTPTPRKLVLGTNSSFGTESIKIERGAGWDGLALTATWHIPGREEPLRVALLDGDAMDVPPEVTKEAKDGVLVLAGLASGVQRASCNVEYLILEQAGVYGGADAEPTPELAAQVLEAALQAKADAEAAAEDAAAAKANADKAQADAEKAQQAAENAAADAAKAGPYAEAARAAQEAAESARDEAIAAQLAAENAAAAAAASKIAADTLAAEAARAAKAAEDSKAAANNAASFAGKNATAAQQAAGTATAAANDAGQSASDAAASKAAAETAAKAARDAQTAAAAAKADAVKAQGAAQTAAKSAQDAQAAAEKARDEAKTAQKGAEAARDTAAKSAEAAAKSEANAKQSADTLAESVENVVANTAAVAELKQQVKNITPDNSSIGDAPWSSKHIIDMLCPPLEESGNPVVCYPVAGYPLGVKASWEPMQEGTGTPSPENIRPIKGRDSVTVNQADGLRAWKMLMLDGTEEWTVSGKFLDNKTDWYYVSSKIPDAINIQPQKGNEICSHYPHADVANNNTVQGCAIVWGSIRVRWGDTIPNDADAWKAYLAAQNAAGTPVQIAYKLKKLVVVPDTNGIFFSDQPAQGGTGDPSPDNIRPILLNNAVQVGQTNTLTLPETVYGGEVDAVSGEGQDTWKMLTLDGTEKWGSESTGSPGKVGFTFQVPEIVTPMSPEIKGDIVCSQYPTISANDTYQCKNGISVEAGNNHYFRIYNDTYAEGTVDEWKSYLATQYAAGTPVQVCYKLAEPVPFTATGAQPIPALAGVNTVLTDADSATVTGRADPIKRITDLEAAVASIN